MCLNVSLCVWDEEQKQLRKKKKNFKYSIIQEKICSLWGLAIDTRHERKLCVVIFKTRIREIEETVWKFVDVEKPKISLKFSSVSLKLFKD